MPSQFGTYLRAHSVGFLLYCSALVFLGDPEALAVEPVVDVPAVDLVADLDLLPNSERRHLDDTRLDVAFELPDELRPEAYCQGLGIDAPPGRRGHRGR